MCLERFWGCVRGVLVGLRGVLDVFFYEVLGGVIRCFRGVFEVFLRCFRGVLEVF